MKQLLLQLPNTDQPKYQLLAEGLRSAIRQGRLRPADVLPSSRELARQFSMNRHTVMKALQELEAESWITAFEKKHYQVVATLPSTFLQAKSVIRKNIPVKENAIRFARRSDVAVYTPLSQYRFSFPSGFPDVSLFPMTEFKSHFYDALKTKNILSYGDPAGHPRLMTQVEEYLRRVRNIAVKDKPVLITNGSQEAIFLLAQLLLQKGDFVAVEALGYPPAMEALKFAGARLLPIAVDNEGLVVDDLIQKLRTKQIRMLYTTPLHQYPTTVTLSARRRLQLYEVCYKNNILILEDDYDHEFHYVSQPIAPLAAFDPAGIVLYVSTFSKILFPSARVGFMAVPEKIRSEIAKLKRISSRQNEEILQESIARWMESGGFEKHLRKMRRTYEERKNSIVTDLESFQEIHPEISWLTPDGGMALWLNLHRDSATVAERAQKNSLLISPENHFRCNKTGTEKGTHLRLGFSGQTPEKNRKGLELLFSLL